MPQNQTHSSMKKDCLETYSAEQDTNTWELQGSLYSRGDPQQKGDLSLSGPEQAGFYTEYMWLCRGFPTCQIGIRRPSKAFQNLPSASMTFQHLPNSSNPSFWNLPAHSRSGNIPIPWKSTRFHDLPSHSVTFRDLLGAFPCSHLPVPTLLSPFPPLALSSVHCAP